MAHDVFISYSSKDKNVADATCAVLEARNIRCWMAPRDILPGSEWGAAIIGAIGAAKVMVLIYTSSSNASPQVRREVERAVARGLHVIPFRVEDVPMSPALEYFISTPHWLDALSPPLERHLEHLGKIIRAVLDAQKSPADLAAEAAAAAVPEASGWTHGPPPGAFSAAAQRQQSAADAGVGAAPAPPGAGSPSIGQSPQPAKSRNTKVLAAGGAVAAVVAAGVIVFAVNSSRETDDRQMSIAGPSSSDLATKPVAPDDSREHAPPDTKIDVPVAQLTPSTKTTLVEPKPAPPNLPDAPAKPPEPGEQDVRRFWELMSEGGPALPRLRRQLEDYPALANRRNAAGNTPLYDAARAGEAGVVSALLDAGADRKATSASNNTALHGVAAGGLTDRQLIESLAPGAIDARNAAGHAPLHVAIAAGHADTVRRLAEAGADVNLPDGEGRTPIQIAMALKDPAAAKAATLALINGGAKVDVADKRGMTPLHYAASWGDASLLQALADKGAKLDAAGPTGRTPLHLAVLSGKPDVVKALLARRAAIDAADEQGYAPLHLAATARDTKVAEMLLAAGAKVTTVNAKDKVTTPLHLAAGAGQTAMVELFMANGGANVLLSGRAPTPIDAAEKAGKTEVAQLLRRLEFPAMLQSTIKSTAQPVPPKLLEMIRKDPALADAGPGTSGRNALHQCAASGNATFAAELIKINPALVRSVTADGFDTPLHLAGANRQAAVAKVLLASGALVRATNGAGDTPLHAAARAGATDVVKLLLDAGSDPSYANKEGRLPADLAPDKDTRSALVIGQREADQLRDAWAAIALEGRGFDARVPGVQEPLRFRFRNRREFRVEGYVNGVFTSREGTYSKGPLTLQIESPEGPLFPGIPGTNYSGKVMAGNDDKRFTWKLGALEIQFE